MDELKEAINEIFNSIQDEEMYKTLYKDLKEVNPDLVFDEKER